MAVSSWHDKPQDIEIDKGLARAGSPKNKSVLSPPPIHPHMANRTDTSLGAPPRGTPQDASSPLPTDSVKQHGMKSMKTFPVPKCHPATPSRPSREPEGSVGSTYDPASANKVVGAAILSGSTRLPDSTSENT